MRVCPSTQRSPRRVRPQSRAPALAGRVRPCAQGASRSSRESSEPTLTSMRSVASRKPGCATSRHPASVGSALPRSAAGVGCRLGQRGARCQCQPNCQSTPGTTLRRAMPSHRHAARRSPERQRRTKPGTRSGTDQRQAVRLAWPAHGCQGASPASTGLWVQRAGRQRLISTTWNYRQASPCAKPETAHPFPRSSRFRKKRRHFHNRTTPETPNRAPGGKRYRV